MAIPTMTMIFDPSSFSPSSPAVSIIIFAADQVDGATVGGGVTTSMIAPLISLMCVKYVKNIRSAWKRSIRSVDSLTT